jgi:hypothetical protein
MHLGMKDESFMSVLFWFLPGTSILRDPDQRAPETRSITINLNEPGAVAKACASIPQSRPTAASRWLELLISFSVFCQAAPQEPMACPAQSTIAW